MMVTRDFRRRHADVTITMSIGEFREHVRIGRLQPLDDAATTEMRGWLDRIDPAGGQGDG